MPELEALAGVLEASADWQSAEVRVRHAAIVEPRQMAELLVDLNYPAESWNSQPLDGVDKW
ncbi:MAG TPA: hypothetical protein VFG86_04340 [Chloroflexota bacterium]|nr:hypothetical protein [Chloroflexota bacterium]